MNQGLDTLYLPADHDTGCRQLRDPKRTFIRGRNGAYEYPVRRAWEIANKHLLARGDKRLQPTCQTKLCGNPEHWAISDRPSRIAEAYWKAVSTLPTAERPTVKDIAVQLGEDPRYAQKVISGEVWRALPDTPSQKKLRNIGELPNDELQTPIDTGTGRIIHIPTGEVYENVRKAEIATGVEREAIAKSCNTKGKLFRYEKGSKPLESEVAYGNGLNYKEFTSVGLCSALFTPLDPEDDPRWKEWNTSPKKIKS